VKTEMSKEGKLEHKHLLHESKQLCKVNKPGYLQQVVVDIFLVTSPCFKIICVLACVATFLCCMWKDKPALCSQNTEVSRRQSLPVC